MERQKEIERERAREEETMNAGPSPRDIEMAQILEQLRPLHLDISTVPADGNCLYRAVAAQHNDETTYQEIRKWWISMNSYSFQIFFFLLTHVNAIMVLFPFQA
jgi:hypothetical protein